MIETPIVGRYVGEGRRLVFGPPAAYHRFVQVVGAMGALLFIAGLLGLGGIFYPFWCVMVGGMLMGAAGFAALSLQLVVFDLKEGTYRRRQGPGIFPSQSHGKISDLDAVVVVSETPMTRPGTITYHVVLHWKPTVPEPILVLHQDARPLPSGQPLNVYAGPVLQLGARYANSLGVKFFDNTYYASPCPVPLW